MRPFLALLTGLVLVQASVARADVDDVFDDAAVTGELDSAAMADAPLAAARAANWNQWTCTARGASFPIRIFRGASYYFRPGSGEGQQAKLVAQKIAVRNCEFSGAHGCTSDLNQCTGHQF